MGPVNVIDGGHGSTGEGVPQRTKIKGLDKPVQCLEDDLPLGNHHAAKGFPVQFFHALVHPIADAITQGIPVDTLYQGVCKDQCRVKPLCQGRTNQPPVQPGDKAVEGIRNVCGPSLGLILDIRPGNRRHGFIQLLGEKLPDLVPFACLDGSQHGIQERAFCVKVIIGGDTAGARTTGGAVLLI